MPECRHPDLIYDPSPHAHQVGFRGHQAIPGFIPTTDRRGNAPGKRKHAVSPESTLFCPTAFPAPLVLPHDELAGDPEYPHQSVVEWRDDEDRNEVTAERNVIYVAAPPAVDSETRFMDEWADAPAAGERVARPGVEQVIAYLAAFYHPLPVRLLASPTLTYTSWETQPKPRSKSKTKATASVNPAPSPSVALSTSAELIRIRARPAPPSTPSFPRPYSHQVNLNDLLDGAIAILPSDAYCLLLLSNHDLYESDEDDFACGRAYGGSRVAVVSSARYHPGLDEMQGVTRSHAWPASHCREYIDACCAQAVKGHAGTKTKRAAQKEQQAAPTDPVPTALQAAVNAFTSASASATSSDPLAALYLARVCRTACHELGHCFGIDHCTAFACVMQGTAGLPEDNRQPMYLCPVDTDKLWRAVADYPRGAERWQRDRYGKLIEFCETHRDGGGLFEALGAWVGIVLRDIDAK